MSQRRSFALRVIPLLSTLALLSVTACSHTNDPEDPGTVIVADDDTGTIVYETDSTEWRVRIFKEHLLYSEAAAVVLPAPWIVPTREDATILRQLEFASPSGERFVTCDGYTFGMPSASVSKAGSKTQYSVLGLWKRRMVIDVPF